MESTLRKTLIKLQSGIELQFWKITRFNKFGCKALFYDPESKNIFDVTVLSKSLLQLNSFSDMIIQNLKKYQTMNSKIICPIHSVTEDGDILYIISEAERYKLSDLVQKRQGLTQFQIIYFVLDLIQLMNYMKSRNMFYQMIEIQGIYLTKNMKILIPFSIWVSSLHNTKPMALRHQDKKGFIAPQYLNNALEVVPDEVNTWNIGIFLYEMIEGVKPFTSNSTQLTFTREVTPLVVQLIQKLLKKNPQERLKFPLILIQDLFKKYPSLPHILPNTIFSCPPSSEYISEYCKNFHEQTPQKQSSANKVLNIHTAYFIQDENLEQSEKPVVKSFKSCKNMKPSDRSLTETRSYINQFVDISHRFGFGYQMSTGMICFCFNDGSEMFFENSFKKSVTYISEKKMMYNYVYEKIPEEGEIKKKLYILEAYVKSIKKFKHSNNTPNKLVTVSQYFKTNSAAVFLLSNQTIEIIFTDRIIFFLTKHSIHVQNKNSDKFQSYENMQVSNEMSARKYYSLAMASKLFHWDIGYLQGIKHKEQTQVFNNSSFIEEGSTLMGKKFGDQTEQF